jgi:hypothetical protein
MGSWPHNTHLTQQYIYKLRNFIHTGIPKEPADPGNPGIVFSSPPGVGILVQLHGSELIASEGPTQESHSFLAEEDGSFGVQLDEEHEDGEKPGKNEQNNGQGSNNIHYSFVYQIIITIIPIGPDEGPGSLFPVIRIIDGRINNGTLHVTKDWFSQLDDDSLAMPVNLPSFTHLAFSNNDAIGVSG